ncbi:MAG: replicative DNA helicase [Buchnera aphidicola (Periphyllus lyropictus)]|uniref:replicative DNA helicase n=1 Tax=Buchnera aphidicola TaxID=9 RepID=UPI001ECF61EB|nr:replicative DNA helicase [Buchnera aphidicola]NIH16452.1 replicative DNA helicase [Buchnera aphidicola (Periphyllus lyropictus)]USS94737.1 replicative DNA helicase [Buchnera aphidicola (Periphyllus lyropictus)]
MSNLYKKNKKYGEKFFNEKIPPYSIEAEKSVLGGLMLKNKKWSEISECLKKKDFFSHSHQIIFNEMKNLANNKKPIDLITLSESLKNKKLLKKIGNFSYLAELSNNIFSISNIISYAKIIKENSLMRELIFMAKKIENLGYNSNGKKSEEILNYLEKYIFKINEKRSKNKKGPKNIKEILNISIKNLEKLLKNPKNKITGIDTGYKDLNKKTFGLQKSDLIIIASRPSMGKTTFAMNVCENASMIYKKPILIFSLEMPCEQIITKMLSSLSRVNQKNLRTGKINDEEWSRISSTINILLKKKNIYIDDSSYLTPNKIRTRALKIYKKNKGISLIMIDYLQLMNAPSISENRNLEIAEISKNLKSLAKELKVPIIALSQLNRSLEQRSDKRPINSDLRESGSIEQDADLIIFIYRDEIYHPETNLKGIAEIIIGKQRNGPIGTIRLTFNGNFSRFDNYAENLYEEK